MGFIIIYNDFLNPKLHVFLYENQKWKSSPTPPHGRDF